MTRGELWWADFGLPFGSESGYRRPVLVLQNDFYNKSKINTIVVVPLTTNILYADAPGNITVSKKDTKLSKDFVIVISQIRAIDKKRLIEKISKINRTIILELENNILFLLGIIK